jgi:hypothetical protein
MTAIYVPPPVRMPSYTIPGPKPVVVRLACTDDEDLVEQARDTDAIALFAPGAEAVPGAGKVLGDYLARLQTGQLEPELEELEGALYDPTITRACLTLEDQQGRHVLTGVHRFRAFAGLAVLIVVLAPDDCEQATIELPLDPQQLF